VTELLHWPALALQQLTLRLLHQHHPQCTAAYCLQLPQHTARDTNPDLMTARLQLLLLLLVLKGTCHSF
jgi:hypothetical protein